MNNSKYLFIVSMNVKSEYENLFNEVYDTEHIPYLLEVPGVNIVPVNKAPKYLQDLDEEELIQIDRDKGDDTDE